MISLSHTGIHKRKLSIKNVLIENFYDPLIDIIIAYDYNFNGILYKTFDTGYYIISLCELPDNQLISCCSIGLKIWDIDEQNYKNIIHKQHGIYRAVIDSNGHIITVPSGYGTIDVWDYKNNNCILEIPDEG